MESKSKPFIDQPKRSRWKRRALIAFVVLVSYILGYGPACGIFAAFLDNLPLPRWVQYALISAWNIFYAPLHWCFEHQMPGSGWLAWYSSLFDPIP